MRRASWPHIVPALTGLGLLYLATQFARNALGVISGDIERELSLHATQTALLAGATFLSYGLSQIPAAALLTRLGPRIVLPLAAALLTAAFLGLAMAETFSGLLAARVVMGMAAAPVLAGAYAVFTGFGEDRFSTLTGLQTAFGRAGVVVATTPLALLVAAVGWRPSFLWAAAATAAAGLAAGAVLLRVARPAPATAHDGLSQLAPLLRSPGFRRAALFQGATSAVGSTILGLWGGPWLANVYGLNVRERGLMLLALALSWFVSAPLWGLLARHASARVLVLAAAAATVLLLAAAAAVSMPFWSLLPWLALLGGATGFYPVVLVALRQSAPAGAIVYLSTLLTAGTMMVVFLAQLATGLVADLFPGTPGSHPEAVYRSIFGLLAGLMGLATMVYAGGSAPPGQANGPKRGEDRPA